MKCKIGEFEIDLSAWSTKDKSGRVAGVYEIYEYAETKMVDTNEKSFKIFKNGVAVYEISCNGDTLKQYEEEDKECVVGVAKCGKYIAVYVMDKERKSTIALSLGMV